jgi:hypothetical protein
MEPINQSNKNYSRGNSGSVKRQAAKKRAIANEVKSKKVN